MCNAAENSGLIRVRVDAQPIRGELEDSAWNEALKGWGAQTQFVGRVRSRNLGKEVTAVAYDAFEPLAERVLSEIALEAQQQWGHEIGISVVHRTGKLQVGEVSVRIDVGSPHRDAAYLASRYVIEELKKRAPIWKKEFYSDGETEWLKGHALCEHSHS